LLHQRRIDHDERCVGPGCRLPVAHGSSTRNGWPPKRVLSCPWARWAASRVA
jgi:hypothetical protein